MRDLQIITLEDIKAHTRVDSTAEDDLLKKYGVSAEDTVLNLIDRSLDEIYDIWGDIPGPIWEACLLLVDHSYAHRSPAEATKLWDVPYTIDAKIKPYMNL